MNVGLSNPSRAPAPLSGDTQLSSIDNVIDVRDLGFHFQNTPGALFDNISFGLKAREIVCLLGESGCGKSTLLRTLAGLEVPVSGTIRFLGQTHTAPHARAALVFQQPSLLPWLDVAGNVGFGLGFRHQPKLDRETSAYRVSHAIQAVGLGGKERLYPSQLSGGMMQRVALARALAREPEVLFADEPFSALDALTRAEMQALLVKLMREWKSAVVMVTHDIDEAIAIADRILLMGGKPARIVREWQVPRVASTADSAGPLTADFDHTTGALRREILLALQALRATLPSLPSSSSPSPTVIL